jgi:hypothetical protein
MTDTKSLYERDFVLWTETQAEALRAAGHGGTNQALDWENLAEEIESLGRSDKRELHSQIYRIIRHLLKLQFSPATDPRSGWRESVVDARARGELVLADSPSLQPQLEQIVLTQMPRAIKRTIFDLGERGEIDPTTERALRTAGYSADQILGDWFPPEPLRSTEPTHPRPRRRRGTRPGGRTR